MSRPTGQRFHLNDMVQLRNFNEHVSEKIQRGKKSTVAFLDNERSTDQNSMMYALYGDIARQSEDLSVQDVRRQCKLTIGIPILRAADNDYSTWYDRTIKPMAYEDKLMLMDHYDVTSMLTKEQASEYLNTILFNYGKQGYALDDPLTKSS